LDKPLETGMTGAGAKLLDEKSSERDANREAPLF
jgi:hypothetical protein